MARWQWLQFVHSAAVSMALFSSSTGIIASFHNLSAEKEPKSLLAKEPSVLIY